MIKKLWHKYVGLPTVVELGKSDCNALPFTDIVSNDIYTWEKYHSEMKAEYPVRYWLNQTLVDSITYRWRGIKNIWYWVKCHTLPSFKFHLIDIRETKTKSRKNPYRYGWIDADNKMLLAMFKILTDYIEKENPIDLEKCLSSQKIKEEGVSDQISSYKEAMALYKWWKVERSWQEKRIENMFNSSKNEKDKSVKQLNIIQWCTATEELEERDTEMLIRLIKIRGSLWT